MPEREARHEMTMSTSPFLNAGDAASDSGSVTSAATTFAPLNFASPLTLEGSRTTAVVG